MTNTELEVVLSELNWSKAKLGREVGVATSTVFKWLRENKVPGSVSRFIRLKLDIVRLGRE